MPVELSLLAAGNEAFREGKYEKALDLYKTALRESPEIAPFLRVNIELAERRMALSSKDAEAPAGIRVDIVLTIYEAAEDVQECLSSIFRNTDGYDVRVIAVNDGSGTALSEWLRAYAQREPRLHLLEHAENNGYTKAINTGLKAATANYVVALNSDTIVCSHWLSGLIRCLISDRKIGIVGALSNAANWQSVPELFAESGDEFAINDVPKGYTIDQFAALVRSASHCAYPRVPVLNGFCFMLKRSVIEAIGYMDEANFPYGYGEEADYCIRAVNAGFDLAIADDVYIFHKKSKSFGHEKRRQLSREGVIALRRKHAGESWKKYSDHEGIESGLRSIRRHINDALECDKKSHDVIVCVHNAPDDVRRCLESIEGNREGIDHVIIVDDSSDTETVRLLEEFRFRDPSSVKIIRTARQSGYTKAANLGLRESAADIRTLLNSDTIVTRGWATKIAAHLRCDATIGIIGPLSNAASHQSVPSTTATSYQTAINDLPPGISPEELNAFCEREANGIEVPYTPLVHGFCFTITKSCIENVGYLDEEAFPNGYGEENDYCIRAQDAGFALAIALDIYIYHAKSKSYQGERRVQLMKEGWAALLRKHGDRRLRRAVQTMENHPILKRMRERVAHEFYREPKEVAAPRERVKLVGELASDEKLKAIAFYLPQFHPTPENDANWGEGFTEWRNVVKARPRYPGHYQPKLPGKFGFYDLRVPEILIEQGRLAKQYGISGFCFYYYRFGEKRVLDLPLRNYLSTKEAELPFCYCWANESWTRAWDGRTSEVLFSQEYDDKTLQGFVSDVAEATADERYIRIEGRPLVIIYQVAEMPNARATIQAIREQLKAATGEHVLIGSVFSPAFKREMLDFIDFVIQFPPHRIPRRGPRVTIPRGAMQVYDSLREDYFESYDEVVTGALGGVDLMEKMWLGVCPDWDNSPRRQRNATMLVGSTPEKFQSWVAKAAKITTQKYREKDTPAPLMFVNAWNEWAEGAIMEPTEEHGAAYLSAFATGVGQ